MFRKKLNEVYFTCFPQKNKCKKLVSRYFVKMVFKIYTKMPLPVYQTKLETPLYLILIK
jgi:hypothetical protein